MTKNCTNCGSEMQKDANSPSKWTCACGYVSFVHEQSISNTLRLRQSHEAAMKSHDKIGESPVREIQEATTPQGDAFVQKVERTAAGSNVERDLRLVEPYRRTQTTKRREECEAVRRLLKAYNATHSTDYDSVNEDQDDRDTDAIATSSSGAHADQPFQVVTEGSQVWRNLAQRSTHAESMSETELMSQLKRDLLNKATRADATIVLVYDAPGVITEGTLELFIKQNEDTLRKLNFKEVWYSSRHSSIVKRLK